MELTSGITRMAIDEKSGSIVLLKNIRTGYAHIDGRNDRRHIGGLFRVISPSKIWSAREADSEDQRPPMATMQGNVLTLRYSELLVKGEATGISAEVKIWPEVDTGEIRFQIKVVNKGREDVTGIQGPSLGGWKAAGGIDMYRMMYSPFIDIKHPGRLPAFQYGTTYLRVHQQICVQCPAGAVMPWLDLSGPGGGISYINWTERPRNGAFFHENMAGYEPGLSLRFGWCHHGLVRPGEEWVSSIVGISVHDGDWRETADRYSRWVDTWFTPPPTPLSLKRSIGYQNVMFRDFNGRPVRDLADIPAAAAAGRRYGVKHLSVWDYMTLGNYSKHTSEDLLDYSDRDRATILKGLSQAKAEGTACSALINFRLASQLTRNYDEKEIAKTYFGLPHNMAVPVAPLNKMYAWLSPFSRSYRERILRQTLEYMELGYNAMFFDQPFAQVPDYSHSNIGCQPEDTHAVLGAMIREMRALLHKSDQNAYMIGELCDPFHSRYIDLWMAWHGAGEPALNVSYAIPQTMNSWVVANSLTRDIEGRMVTDALSQASFGFAAGLQLCFLLNGGEATLDDLPELGAHVKQLADLREATAQRTTMARFRGPRGIAVEGDGLLAYAFDSAAGPAVTVTALDSGANGKVKVDRKMFSAPGNPDCGRVCRLGGGTADIRGDECEFNLKPNEPAVWML